MYETETGECNLPCIHSFKFGSINDCKTVYEVGITDNAFRRHLIWILAGS